MNGFGLIVGYEIARRINSYDPYPYHVTHQAQRVNGRTRIAYKSTASSKGTAVGFKSSSFLFRRFKLICVVCLNGQSRYLL